MDAKKNRQSNIELLRIVAIFFVLIGHVGVVMGLPSGEDFVNSPISSMTRILFSSFAVGGVNIFVLISGWFGIQLSGKGVGRFVYQVLFLLWGIYLIMICIGHASFYIEGIKISMGLTGIYWFVMAYLGLYILSPVLNAFCEYSKEKQFRFFLILFYCFQAYYCWISGFLNYFEGYSIVFFCGLYLTARYFRIYPVKFVEVHAWKIYIGCCVLIFIIASFGQWKWGNALRMLRYDNPIVILASVSLLYVFSKWQFQSKLINKLATGCFAVYIIHFNPFIFKYFKIVIIWLEKTFSGLILLMMIALFLISVFIICVIIDQVRVKTWNVLEKIIK